MMQEAYYSRRNGVLSGNSNSLSEADFISRPDASSESTTEHAGGESASGLPSLASVSFTFATTGIKKPPMSSIEDCDATLLGNLTAGQVNERVGNVKLPTP
jgi:hypothetical protein